MMEKVELGEQKPRRTDAEIAQQCPWAVVGKPADRKRNVITSLALESPVQEAHNIKLQTPSSALSLTPLNLLGSWYQLYYSIF